MAVNARTFQILYIVRARASEDKPTRLDDFAEFIADRRKSAPDIYSRAYIAPSAMVPILQRMTTGDNLLTLDPVSHSYEFTPRGSQMADLLIDLDACSEQFIDNYKEKVCQAVLQQRQRLGQGAATAREVAAIANISLDSARRGLESLGDQGLAEYTGDRTLVYSLPKVPEVVKVDKEVARIIDSIEAGARLDAALDNIIEDDDDNEDEAPLSLPDLIVRQKAKAAKAADDVRLAGIEAAARLIAETEDDPDYDPIRAALAEIDENETAIFGLGKNHKILKPLQDEAPPINDDDDGLPLSFDAVLPTEDEEEEVCEKNVESGPYAWESVSEKIREGLIIQAKAAGLTLDNFFDLLGYTNQQRIREALFAGAELQPICTEPPDQG